MKKKLNCTKKEKYFILIALCNYKYDWCIPNSSKWKYIDKILDKYFKEKDFFE